jgi:hypothetical protein
MPQQSVGAVNGIMAGVGNKLIRSGINYEAEFKLKLSSQQAQAPQPQVREIDITEVIAKCSV